MTTDERCRDQLSAAIANAITLDPEHPNILLGSYQHAITATGKVSVAAAWSMYAAQRDGVNANLPNLKVFREKTSHIGGAIYDSTHRHPALPSPHPGRSMARCGGGAARAPRDQ